MMTKERYIYLDFAKIIGIWLVILGHYTASMNVPFENNTIWHMMFNVTLFHMPLFFVISGLLYKPTDLKKTVQKGYTQLLLPYLIMGIIGLTLEYILSQFNIKVLVKGLLGIFSGNDLGGYGTLSYTRPIWFLYSLFIIKVFMSLSQRARLGEAVRELNLRKIVVAKWQEKPLFRRIITLM